DAYERHGIEEFLSEHGIRYTFIDSHLLRGGKAIGAYADRFEGLKLLVQQMEKEHSFVEQKGLTPYSLYNLKQKRSGKSGVTLFTRDPKSGLQVWSGEWGYPGDGWYMDFHKKRFPGGLRYWKVTSATCGLGDKEVYDPEKVEERIDENAAHYVDLIHKVLQEHKDTTGREGVLTSPFDFELFGHWWFEGIRFIKKVYQKLDKSSYVTTATARENVDVYEPEMSISIPEGSWGEGGFHYIWLNEHNEWTWRDLYRDELITTELVEKAKKSDNQLLRQIVIQIVRELMLAHSSDWQFLISTFSARDYAEMRFDHHHNSLLKLADMANRLLSAGELTQEDKFLFTELQEQDHPFKDLSLEWYSDLP
ncbi:1,4-alpha-glucan branching protein domain-containing protein, partial [candidate division KSB1 bacterium]